MYDQLCDELDVQFRRNGSITLANDDEEIAILEMLLNLISFKSSIASCTTCWKPTSPKSQVKNLGFLFC